MLEQKDNHLIGDLPYTGERMIPSAADASTFWEHVERYRFAAGYVRGLSVLDIACGEGYGSAALMAAGAASLIGVDISLEAVAHAMKRHGVDARVGSATAIPIADQSVDLIVSFETIEHVQNPPAFIEECWRVLRPKGRLIISTPNPKVYKDVIEKNPFHLAEMPVDEFRKVISERFSIDGLYGQTVPPAWYMRTRGFGRLTRWLQTSVGGRRMDVVDAEARAQAVQLASSPTKYLNHWLYTDAVQSMLAKALEHCCYVVAVATRRDG